MNRKRLKDSISPELGGLWILPDLRKTPTTRFPQVLGRRQRRAAHRLHRPGDENPLNNRMDRTEVEQAI